MTFRLKIAGEGVLEIIRGKCTPQMDEFEKRFTQAVRVDGDGNEHVESRELRESAYWHWTEAGSGMDSFLGRCFGIIQNNWDVIKMACEKSQAVKILIAIDEWGDSNPFVYLSADQVQICAEMNASFDVVVNQDE